jgi:YD repeat-containing protein
MPLIDLRSACPLGFNPYESRLPTVVNYAYDVLNRLSTVAEANTGTTQYNFDAVGNLASFTEPNGVVHAYTYDTQNRLTNLAVNNSSGPF